MLIKLASYQHIETAIGEGETLKRNIVNEQLNETFGSSKLKNFMDFTEMRQLQVKRLRYDKDKVYTTEVSKNDYM